MSSQPPHPTATRIITTGNRSNAAQTVSTSPSPSATARGRKSPIRFPPAFSDQWYHPFPTFNLALAYAKTMRVKHPILADCHIYACTDCVMESSSSGRFAVQLVSPSHIYRPNGLGPIRNQ